MGGAGGGTGTGNTNLPGCGKQHALIPGTFPDSKWLAGNFSGSGDQILMVDGSAVKDGHEYACAVAGVDIVGNVGPISNVSCVIPQTTDDFFGTYRGDSGMAGGGFCTIGRSSSAVAATSAVVGLSLLAFASRRRRRRN
jgi:hypothetical protein